MDGGQSRDRAAPGGGADENVFDITQGVAIAIFAVMTLFQLVTLPVEFDASRRAKAQLLRWGLVHSQESEHVSKVLNAAALTYVAALVTAVLQLLHLITMARGSNRD